MSKASKIIICIVTCLLVVSIPFINTVQSLEVKQVFKEKKTHSIIRIFLKFQIVNQLQKQIR